MTIKVRCWLCWGDGKGTEGKSCMMCKGTGELEVSDEEARHQLLQKQIRDAKV